MQENLALLLPLFLLVLMMVFMWRSNKKNRERQQQMRAELAPGVEVMTQGGIFGTLTEVDSDENIAIIESTPGTSLKVHLATIVNVISPEVVVPDDASSLTDNTSVVDDSANSTAAESVATESDAATTSLADAADLPKEDGDDEADNEQPKA